MRVHLSVAGACTQIKILELDAEGEVKAISRKGQIGMARVYLLGFAGTHRGIV